MIVAFWCHGSNPGDSSQAKKDSLVNEFSPENGTPVLYSDGQVLGTIENQPDHEAMTGSSILVRCHGRLLRIPQSMIDFDRSGAETIVLVSAFVLPPDVKDNSGSTIEAHEEQLTIDVSETEQGKIRIVKSVEHFPVHQDIELGMHMLDIEHVPSGEEFDEMPQSWYDGATLVIPVVEEVLVLTRRYRVTENVRVTRRREVHTERVEADLRREVISIYEEDAEGNPIGPES